MAEDLHHNALVNTLGEQEGGGGVPGVMDPHPTDTGCFQQGLPFVPVGMGADRPPIGLAPDEVAITPGSPGRHALMELDGPVRSERRYELGREGDRPSAFVGFRFGEMKPTAGSLRARTSVAGAAMRAVVAMAVLGASTRVGAAMPPGKALKLPANGQCPGVKIDMLPPEPKCLALAQPQSQGHAPSGTVPP